MSDLHPAPWDVNNPDLDNLYRIVGRVAVAGGHCEWAMQRMWLNLTEQGPEGFLAAAKLSWSSLETKIVALATEQGRSAVLEVMHWPQIRS